MTLLSPAVITLGMFDGVHMGHRALIQETLRQSKALCAEPIVHTFSDHPLNVLGGSVRLLSSIRERNSILRALGISEVVSTPFTEAVANTEPRDYIRSLLEERDVRAIVAGYNHTFGKRGEGDAKLLRALGEELGFEVSIVPPVLFEGEPVSSSRIRALLEAGCVEKAAQMLCRRYTLSGRVIGNKRIGRRIGFPTANIAANETRVLPQNGVYATNAYVNGSMFRAVTNIGTNPTVGGETLSVETHLIDFDDDIYDQELTIAFCRRLRGETTFADADALKAQIALDVARASSVK